MAEENNKTEEKPADGATEEKKVKKPIFTKPAWMAKTKKTCGEAACHKCDVPINMQDRDEHRTNEHLKVAQPLFVGRRTSVEMGTGRCHQVERV